MNRKLSTKILAGIAVLLCTVSPAAAQITLTPRTMTRVGSVDPRFQSYNVEMVEVTGGRFWKPYASAAQAAPAHSELKTPGGIDPSLYRYRPPLDMGNERLRKLAAALGPAYIRVSGTWATSAYFQDTGGQAPAAPPKGFGTVLTRAERGAIRFQPAI